MAQFDLVALSNEHLSQDSFHHQSLNSPVKTIETFQYLQLADSLYHDKESQQAEDIERFRWFSQDYLGFDDEKNLVTDVRYSMLPNQIEPMWGLVIDDQRDINEHAIWWTGRGLSTKLRVH